MSVNATNALRDFDKAKMAETNAKSATGHSKANDTKHMSDAEKLELNAKIDDACAHIAPLWPLKHFVAVNPFFGLSDKTFQNASDTLARILGHGIYMSRDYYQEQLSTGRITKADLKAAIELCDSQLTVNEIEDILARPAPQAKMGMAPVSKILERVEGGLWSSFVTERISLHCAAYFDMGQATINMPWQDQSLYSAWRKAAAIDMSPAMMGIGDFRHAVSKIPEEPREAIAWAIEELAIPDEAIERYLHASLLSIGGWAAWTRYLRWQAELTGSHDNAIVDLLAIRVMWDILLYQEKYSFVLAAQWRDMLESSMRLPSTKRQAAAEIDRIMLRAMEFGFQRDVISSIKCTTRQFNDKASLPRPAVQAAFCIDVRSEVYRRALETVSPQVRTLGFAGFFGIFIEYVPLGANTGRSHVPVLFEPANRIYERVKADDKTNQQVIDKRRQRLALSKLWKGFKYSASSTFSFVEVAGLMYAPKLLSDSFGWSRPVPNPITQGLNKLHIDKLAPSIDSSHEDESCSHHEHGGIPQAEWLDHAERILRAMTMTDNFARLVLLTGHGGTTVNNPHATALDCGACAGQTGEASARIVAALLNKPQVRDGLRERGIIVPQDTWFIAGLHDTTTDEVKLFDTEAVPDTLATELKQLHQWLEQASELARTQRAPLMGLNKNTDRAISNNIFRRANDWSQVRPEWALANNGAFIAASRHRTRGSNLDGRAFLHDYCWQEDKEFKILELIMTAPMVVANWINMQYYGSVVDNETFGSGNKVLHNIVGGAIGVLEGNSGDLRVGLPMQSLHNGERWMHEPLRLSAFIEAPKEAIDDIIERHKLVQQIVENGWMHLFQINDDENIYLRDTEGNWQTIPVN
jgi:uncharacterized protein